jgi:succinate dehydrogenase / fumarate reductase cytochrome b subunit
MASTEVAPGKLRPRPLSPHLLIYKFTITMMMSIVHRICGAALYVGVLLLAWFLIAASTDAAAFDWFSWFISSILGQLILFAFTWALFTHLCGGVRHFIWDAGYGMEAPTRDYLAWATAVGGLGLAVVTWIIGYLVW